MLAWQSLIVVAAVSAPGDAALLQFSSQNCPACRTVAPVVQRLATEGYNVQQIDVDQQPDLARRFQIHAVPTFVVVRDGQEAGRLEGASTYDRLVQLLRTGELPAQQAAPPAVAQAAFADTRAPLQTTDFRGANPVPQPAGPATDPSAESPMKRALYATVRLKVEDDTGFGYGTGTIIDRHGDEALVITCGHIFRQSQGKGKVTADLFAPGATGPVDGQVVGYDLERDIALVSIRPGIAIQSVPVGGPDYGVKPHDPAFSIGCDKGASASIRETRITAINKYKGPPNLTAAGQPIDGRSGGGLFSAEGVLIGICNAADPQDDEGLYAGPGSIHWQLDQIGQSEIYRRSNTAVAAATPSAPVATDSRLAQPEPTLPAMPTHMPTAVTNAAHQNPSPVGLSGGNARPAITNVAHQNTPAQNVAPLGPPTQRIGAPTGADEMEVIMILRSKHNPQRQSEIIVLDHASPELLQQITAASRAPLSSQLGDRPVVRAQGE